MCNAFNDIGSTQKVFYIVVNGIRDKSTECTKNSMLKLCVLVALTDPPVITSSFPTNLTVFPGENVNLKCEAIGNPVPVVYWKNQEHTNGLLSSI